MSNQLGMPLFEDTNWHQHIELARTGFITSTRGVLELFGIHPIREAGKIDDEQDQALNKLANSYWMAIRLLAEIKNTRIDLLNELLSEIDESVYVEVWDYIRQKRDEEAKGEKP